MTTAKRSHIRSPSTQMTTVSDEPTMDTTASATRTRGMESRVVTRKLTTMSTRPPKYPATMPSRVPMTPEISMAEKPISSEICAPYSRRER